MKIWFDKKMGYLVFAQGICHFLGGIGLFLFNSKSVENATSLQKSSESFGAGTILLYLLSFFLVAYSVFFLIAGSTLIAQTKGGQVFGIFACLAATVQSFFVTPIIVGGFLNQGSDLNFLLVFTISVACPLYGVVAFYGWWQLLGKKQMAIK